MFGQFISPYARKLVFGWGPSGWIGICAGTGFAAPHWQPVVFIIAMPCISCFLTRFFCALWDLSMEKLICLVMICFIEEGLGDSGNNPCFFNASFNVSGMVRFPILEWVELTSVLQLGWYHVVYIYMVCIYVYTYLYISCISMNAYFQA